MEGNSDRNKRSVVSLKVSAVAEQKKDRKARGNRGEDQPNRGKHQSRRAVDPPTKATAEQIEPKAAMGEASSLKRAAGPIETVMGEDQKKKPAKQLKTKGGKKPRKKIPVKEGATAGRWSAAEHAAFLQGLALYGREWKRVAADIPTRSASQVRSHAQKYFAKLQKEREEEWINNANQHHSRAAAGVLPGAADPPLSDSVRREAARILAHPETVESEVRSTLQQLRERYKQLQRRLEERNSEMGSIQSAVSDDEMIALHVLQGGLSNNNKEHDGPDHANG